MTTYRYDSMPAIDDAGTPARGATGQVYAVTDLTRSSPLLVTDLTGITLANLRTNHLGILPPFMVEDHKEVVWKSGAHEQLLVSVSGILDDVEAARQAAIAAETAAQQAAGLVGAPSTTAVATMFNTPGNAAYDAVVALIQEHGGGGGTGDAQAENLEAIRRYDPDTEEWPAAERGNFKRIVWEGPASVPTPTGPDGAQPGDIRRRLVEE